MAPIRVRELPDSKKDKERKERMKQPIIPKLDAGVDDMGSYNMTQNAGMCRPSAIQSLDMATAQVPTLSDPYF